MGIVDKANDYAQRELDASIAAARGIPSPQGDPKQSADECILCGELIPSERQIAVPGCQLCIDCAIDKEKPPKVDA